MENKIDITKLKAQDFMNELPEMVRSLEAVRSGSQDKKPVEVTFGELVTGKWGISEDEPHCPGYEAKAGKRCASYHHR